MAEIKKYLDSKALETLVAQIKAEDAKGLKSAKDYADGLASNYDAAGAAASAESNAKKYTDELANGAVKANTEAIAKLNGDASTDGSVAKAVADAKALVDADVDAVEVIANKNKEDIAAINNAETGILATAKGYTNTEVAKVQGAVDALEAYVGTIPEGATATNVVAYVQEKTTGIATEGAMTELAGRVTTVEGKVATIEGDYLKAADKTALEGKIAEVQAAVDTEKDRAEGIEAGLAARIKTVEDDYLKAADKTELAEAIAGEKSRAEGEEDKLATRIKAVEDDYLKAADKAELEGKITAEETRAKGVESGLDTRVKAIEDDYLKAEDKEALQTQINTIMNNPDAEGAINSINEFTQYVKDHGTIADGFRADIDQNKTDIAANTTAIGEEATRATAAEEALGGRIDELAADYDAHTHSWNDLTDKPFYEEGNAPITWDGVVGDRPTAPTPGTNIWVKISDKVLDADDLIGGTLTRKNGTTFNLTANSVMSIPGGVMVGEMEFISVFNTEEFYNAMGIDAPETGTYTIYTEDGSRYIQTVTFPAGGIKTLDDKFISANIARVADVDALAERVTTAEGKIATLEGEMDAVEGAVATKAEKTYVDEKVEALEGADTALGNRIAALEGKVGEGDGSVADLIATAKQEAIDAAATDAADKAAVVLAESQKYTDAEIDKVEATVAALTETVGTKAAASDVTALAGRVTTAEGEIDTLQSEMDAVEAKAAANETAIGTINTELAKKAAQTDLDGAVARIAQNETDIAALEEAVADKADTTALNAAIDRIAKNEQDIAANTSAIAAFAPITAEEITALFA